MQNYLKNLILSKENKMISYSEFMGLALYHPELGYYMKAGEKVGRKGDFITTSNISDIYGRSIAKWYFKQVKELELSPSVCEIGAGNGRFASAFIDEWKKISDIQLSYFIVEESPFHRNLQREIIHFDEQVKQVESIEDLQPFNGLVFSNELFDALPVHVVEKQNNTLMEVMITVEDDKLVETVIPLENPDIRDFIEENFELKHAQRIEVPIMMKDMIARIANVLRKGLVITIDYGYTNEEWMDPARRKGSLRGYYKHEMIEDVLKNPGNMDITSHVHFDSLIQMGEDHGLHFLKKFRQDEFFISIGLLDELQDNYDPNPFSEVSRRNRAIRSLVMPNGMSTYFHAILQEKGLGKINI
ncbi:class I SAM-dependent methyltransferase [Cytobacillus sp. FJAT-54145]|uniref:Class I SAM-dependent methyltransferase n=1 Tax=Cytobacillus spartinae TaxID=3299023 RepID=A0ABW6KGW7_9BACI